MPLVMLFTLAVGIFAYVMFSTIPASVHKKMTIHNSNVWDYGTFEVFLEQFFSREWKRESTWPESFFDGKRDFVFDHSDSYIHAGVIRFDGKGMVLRHREYRKFVKFIKQNKMVPEPRIKIETAKNTTGLWN